MVIRLSPMLRNACKVCKDYTKKGYSVCLILLLVWAVMVIFIGNLFVDNVEIWNNQRTEQDCSLLFGCKIYPRFDRLQPMEIIF